MIAAIAAATGRPVSRETFGLLQAYERLLRDESRRQNLIAESTLDDLWDRHILDSAQLVRFAPRPDSCWVDIGSGAGLPGIVIAALTEGPVTLVEPRRLRADFLERAAAELGLAPRVTVARGKAEAIRGQFDVITGRAVASLTRFLGISAHLARDGTLWVLPKGRGANKELAEARGSWQCDAENVASVTDPEAAILVLRNVRARGRQ